MFAYVYIGDFTFKISVSLDMLYKIYTVKHMLWMIWDSVVMYPSLDIQNMIWHYNLQSVGWLWGTCPRVFETIVSMNTSRGFTFEVCVALNWFHQDHFEINGRLRLGLYRIIFLQNGTVAQSLETNASNFKTSEHHHLVPETSISKWLFQLNDSKSLHYEKHGVFTMSIH